MKSIISPSYIARALHKQTSHTSLWSSNPNALVGVLGYQKQLLTITKPNHCTWHCHFEIKVILLLTWILNERAKIVHRSILNGQTVASVHSFDLLVSGVYRGLFEDELLMILISFSAPRRYDMKAIIRFVVDVKTLFVEW